MGESLLCFCGMLVGSWTLYLHFLTFPLSFTGRLVKKVKVRVVLVRARNWLKREWSTHCLCLSGNFILLTDRSSEWIGFNFPELRGKEHQVKYWTGKRAEWRENSGEVGKERVLMCRISSLIWSLKWMKWTQVRFLAQLMHVSSSAKQQTLACI